MATAPKTLHVYGKYMYGVWNVRTGEKMHVMKTPNGGSCEKSYGKCMFSAFPCPVVRHTRRHRNRRRYYAPRTLKCSGPSSALPSSGGPADPAAPRRHSALPLVQRARQFCLRCRCISGSDCASGRNATGSCFTAEKHKKLRHDCAS